MEHRRSVRLGRATSLLAAVLLSHMVPALLSAQVGPLGSEFQVNTYTTGDQGLPAVAAASNGDFVVV